MYYHRISDYSGIDHRPVYIHIRKLQTFEKAGDKMKYTSGPWKDYWGETNDGEQIFQIHKENDSTKIMQGSKSDTDTSLKELEANVKLIAAAPELLEISMKLLKKFDNYEEITGTIEEVAETVEELRKIIINWRLATHGLHSK